MSKKHSVSYEKKNHYSLLRCFFQILYKKFLFLVFLTEILKKYFKFNESRGLFFLYDETYYFILRMRLHKKGFQKVARVVSKQLGSTCRFEITLPFKYSYDNLPIFTECT